MVTPFLRTSLQLTHLRYLQFLPPTLPRLGRKGLFLPGSFPALEKCLGVGVAERTGRGCVKGKCPPL